jgi:DNA polymerase I-like protein with 3'-5' exonuclease and polymerase domains
VIADFSQIEFRILMTLADEHEVLQAFRDRRDLYCEFGSMLYRRKITSKDIKERLLSKTACLSLGYMAGKPRFAMMCRNYGLDVSRELPTRHTIFFGKSIPAFRDFGIGVPVLFGRLPVKLISILRRVVA